MKKLIATISITIILTGCSEIKSKTHFHETPAIMISVDEVGSIRTYVNPKDIKDRTRNELGE